MVIILGVVVVLLVVVVAACVLVDRETGPVGEDEDQSDGGAVNYRESTDQMVDDLVAKMYTVAAELRAMEANLTGMVNSSPGKPADRPLAFPVNGPSSVPVDQKISPGDMVLFATSLTQWQVALGVVDSVGITEWQVPVVFLSDVWCSKVGYRSSELKSMDRVTQVIPSAALKVSTVRPGYGGQVGDVVVACIDNNLLVTQVTGLTRDGVVVSDGEEGRICYDGNYWIVDGLPGL